MNNHLVSVENNLTNDISDKGLKGSISNYNTHLFWYPKAKKKFRYNYPLNDGNDVNEAHILMVLSNRPIRLRRPHNASL